MVEVPVGFKWFVPGLIDGSFGFGGEESAGASFLRRDGSTWTTDKDGILLCLLASEILATTGRSPSQHYADLVAAHGDPAYARVDAPANREQKAKLAALSPDDVTATELAGEPITAKLTEAPGNGANDRRPQGHDGERVVRRAAQRHRGRLQDLRRVVPRARPPRRGAGGRTRGRLRGARAHDGDADRPAALGLLDALVGEWTEEVTGHGDPTGTVSFDWALDGAYLLQRSTLPPPFPASLASSSTTNSLGEFRQHYFDSRGVTRTYRMTFTGLD